MKTRGLILLAALLASSGVGVWLYLRAEQAPAGKKAGGAPVPVTVVQAGQRDLVVMLDIPGRTEAVESVTVKSRLEGQVRSVAFTEGRHVRRGDVLLQLDPADFEARLRQVEANLARDRAQFAKARADVERYLALRAKGFVSEEKVGEMRTAASAAEAAVNADQAAADLARLQLGYATITAPIDGVVGARLVFPGSAVKINDTALAVVNRMQPLNVAFAVPEKYLPRLHTGRSTLTVAVSLPGAGGTPMTGEVRFIDNAVDAATGTIQLKAALANEGEALRPGQFVNVGLALETLSQAVAVPAEAVQQGPDGAFLYVVADEVAQVRKVRVAATQSGVAAIAEGLTAGETVVTDGQLRLTPGARVKTAK